MEPTLYLMLGYPGAGKTATSRVIHELTGAVHLWADHERRLRFDPPTHSHKENLKLYGELNVIAESLLKEGKSVIFDTNFNFLKDRQKMREIAAKHGADVKLVWVVTPRAIAKDRATHGAQLQDTRVLGNMPASEFERMSNNLEEPTKDEAFIEVDGTKVTPQYIKTILEIT